MGRRRRSAKARDDRSSTRDDEMPAFSPDGHAIAFASDRTGTPEIWLARPDGSVVVRVTTLGKGWSNIPAWSPDGRTLAFGHWADPGRLTGPCGTSTPSRRREDLRTASPTRQTPRHSRTGRGMGDQSISSESTRMARAPSVSPRPGRRPSSLSRRRVRSACKESPDGRFVFFPRDKAIRRIPVAGGDEVEVVRPHQAIFRWLGRLRPWPLLLRRHRMARRY